MPREYRHIKAYEKEILELKGQGYTKREIGERFDLSYEQVHNFISRHNERQRKIAAGIAIRKKGRPSKDSVVTEEDKLADLRYKLAHKEARIKQLEIYHTAVVVTTYFYNVNMQFESGGIVFSHIL